MGEASVARRVHRSGPFGAVRANGLAADRVRARRMRARRRRAWRVFPAVACAIAVLGLRPAPGVAQQDVEEILSYDVVIDVESGGRMLVEEQIRVRALGREIRRGIYRDVPTSFPRWIALGRIEAPFEVIDVTRDGAPEPFSLEGIGGEFGRGGMRIRIGDADVLLAEGVHSYVVRYRTERWVDFGDSVDRLYWNVTGNGWSFPIRAASARIRIDDLRSRPELESWTGQEGSTATTASETWDGDSGTATFRTESTLPPGAGLTVRLTFPTGELAPPSAEQQAAWQQLDWGGYIEAGYLVLLVIAVYLLMWRRVGMDPPTGRVGAVTEPPPGYSPAALGFIESRGYEQKQIAAALVSMALKGVIRIRDEDGLWTLEKVDGAPGLASLDEEERALLDALLGSRSEIPLRQSHHASLRSGVTAFRKSLGRRLEREYFVNNRRWFFAGLAVSVVGLLLLAWRWRFAINPVAAFLALWLTLWTAGTATLVYRLVQQARSAMSTRNPVEIAGTAFLALFSLPFVGAEIVVMGLLFTMMPTHLVLAAVAIGVTNVVFYHLLERPTLKGRGVLDHLAAFRRYMGDERELTVGTHDRAARFERFLPFAIALGLEARWTDAFGDLLNASPLATGEPGPLRWYDHDHGTFDARTFSSSIGSGLSSSLSSASSPPSSSSGGGGSSGGSSGGGGGGGGGGGW